MRIKIIGAVMLATPIVVLAAFMVRDLGIGKALTIWVSLLLFAAWMGLGAYLLAK